MLGAGTLSVNPDSPNRTGPPAKTSLDKGLLLLQVIGYEPDGLTLTEVSKRLDLDKATALRLLKSLEKLLYIERITGKRYRLGPTIFQLANAMQEKFYLRSTIEPALKQLSEITGETSAFFIYS